MVFFCFCSALLALACAACQPLDESGKIDAEACTADSSCEGTEGTNGFIERSDGPVILEARIEGDAVTMGLAVTVVAEVATAEGSPLVASSRLAVQSGQTIALLEKEPVQNPEKALYKATLGWVDLAQATDLTFEGETMLTCYLEFADADGGRSTKELKIAVRCRDDYDSPFTTACAGDCIDPKHSTNNCGGCGNSCTTNACQEEHCANCGVSTWYCPPSAGDCRCFSVNDFGDAFLGETCGRTSYADDFETLTYEDRDCAFECRSCDDELPAEQPACPASLYLYTPHLNCFEVAVRCMLPSLEIISYSPDIVSWASNESESCTQTR